MDKVFDDVIKDIDLTQDFTNPDVLSQTVQDTIKNLTPETLASIKTMVSSKQGRETLEKLLKSGQLNPGNAPGMTPDFNGIIKHVLGGLEVKVVLITQSRQAKSRKLLTANSGVSVRKILGIDDPVQLGCRRLAVGPLYDKYIKVWYDANRKSKNSRGSKIMGFPVGGELIFMLEGENLELEDFLATEKLLG